MGFSNFRLQVALRVVLLTACICTAIWGRMVAGWVVTPGVALLLAGLVAAELIWFVERGQREMSAFLSSIAHQDYSVPIPSGATGRAFDRMERVYRLISDEFKRLNLQKAANHQYLESVIEHVGVALVSIDEAGDIVMMNEPARRLCGLQHVQSVKSFARFDPRLPALLEQLQDGGRDLLRVQRGDEVLQIVLYATEFTLLGRRHKLVSFQNIRDELEKREIESWQKLIRVLTHEIMNSVTPIISLSKLVQETLSAEDLQGRVLEGGERDDLLRSVNAVHSRSNGLLEFVKAYRSFATVPAPAFQPVEAGMLLRRTGTLMADILATQRVALDIDFPDQPLHIRVDPQQIEQVLINLLRNAAEALGEQPEAEVRMRVAPDDRGRVVIQVTDNGPGIEAAYLENIFVPFFTTKRGGTGVGLSVSRQLVQANRGFIFVKPAEPRGCTFTLVFPAA
jgi:nitrogen fixation/metabolism regulation signal transduction histidine kinase